MLTRMQKNKKLHQEIEKENNDFNNKVHRSLDFYFGDVMAQLEELNQQAKDLYINQELKRKYQK